MEMSFLGTSSGAPTKTRNVSAITLTESQSSTWYLIDCGEGTQHQLLKSSLSMNSLGAILITHVHGDHCYGLPGLLASAGLHGRKTPMRIVAPSGLKEWLNITFDTTETYLPYELEFIALDELSNHEFGQFSVTYLELSHRVRSYAYSFIEKEVKLSLDITKLQSAGIPQGPLWGKIQSGDDLEYNGKIYRHADFVEFKNKPRKVIICGDNDQPSLLEHDIQDCDVLVHEATYTADMSERASQVGHCYASLIADFAQTHSVPNLVLTHFSARYSSSEHTAKTIHDLHDEAKAEYTGRLFLANDFDRFSLDKSGELALLKN